MSSVLALGGHTVTGMLAAGGREFEDWSSAYRIFEKGRFDRRTLFAVAQKAALESMPSGEPLTVLLDDTLIRKRGRKISGTAWKRDPLGPAWHTNFVWGQRYLQLSVALPEQDGNGRAVGIPVDFIHAPGAKKPRKNAPCEAWDKYKAEQEKLKLGAIASARLDELAGEVTDRTIICAVDGGYTNKTVFRDKDERINLIGRIRKDACLYGKPGVCSVARGRKKYYGDRLQTPEEIRQNKAYPWQTVEAYAAGKRHTFDVKTLPDIRWKGTGDRDVSLLIIRPLAYRPRKGAELLYREPAYLICTNPALPLNQILQSYLWRWEIEVNFRDEKHVMGLGEAQVRTKAAVENVPALVCAAYSYLLLSGIKSNCNALCLPRPKWYPAKQSDRCTTQQLIALFRTQLWGLAIRANKRDFANDSMNISKPPFFNYSLPSAICHARK